MELVKSIEVGKRYVQTYRDGSTRIALKARTSDPKPAKIVDVKPVLTKDQAYEKLPVEKWAVTKNGVLQVGYEVKDAELVKEPVVEITK